LRDAHTRAFCSEYHEENSTTGRGAVEEAVEKLESGVIEVRGRRGNEKAAPERRELSRSAERRSQQLSMGSFIGYA
jgi:hypothetical protein